MGNRWADTADPLTARSHLGGQVLNRPRSEVDRSAASPASTQPRISAPDRHSGLRCYPFDLSEVICGRPARPVHPPEPGHRHDQALLSEAPQRPGHGGLSHLDWS